MVGSPFFFLRVLCTCSSSISITTRATNNNTSTLKNPATQMTDSVTLSTIVVIVGTDVVARIFVTSVECVVNRAVAIETDSTAKVLVTDVEHVLEGTNAAASDVTTEILVTDAECVIEGGITIVTDIVANVLEIDDKGAITLEAVVVATNVE